jgi:hypothetical protein
METEYVWLLATSRLRELLQRAHDGESPDSLILEEFVNAKQED